MTKNLQTLISRICTIPLKEGCNETKIPYLSIYRYTVEKIEMPKSENLYLYVVLDGSIRLYTPSGIMDYMAGQYSASQIDTPISGHILTFSERIINGEIENVYKTSADRKVINSVSRLISIINEPIQLAKPMTLKLHWLPAAIHCLLAGKLPAVSV